MTYDGNWLLESGTGYDTGRSQLIMIKELYGVFKIDKLSVSNQRGMNIAYVTTTLAATLTNAQEYSKYAS